MTLFDPEPLTNAPAVADDETLSPDQRRTRRRAALLADGFNPRTRLPLLNNGQTCGDCIFHFERTMAKTHHKCGHGHRQVTRRDGSIAYVDVSFGPATDVRVGWPACTAWQKNTSPPIENEGPPATKTEGDG